MASESELFLSFPPADWSAISSIATLLAVVVALFLPFYYERKKKQNLGRLIEYELKKNIELLVLRPRSSDMFSGCLYSVKSRFLLSHISIHTLLILQNMYVENGFNAIPFLQIPNRH